MSLNDGAETSSRTHHDGFLLCPHYKHVSFDVLIAGVLFN